MFLERAAIAEGASMVVLNRIYTKTGDAGTTALGSGERVHKTSPRIAAYGTVDEANAQIGVARIHTAGVDDVVDAMLLRIQNDLFDLGADLCVPDRGEEPARRRLDLEAVRRAGGVHPDLAQLLAVLGLG